MYVADRLNRMIFSGLLKAMLVKWHSRNLASSVRPKDRLKLPEQFGERDIDVEES